MQVWETSRKSRKSHGSLGNLAFKRANLAFKKADLAFQKRARRGPGRARICPAGIFPTGAKKQGSGIRFAAGRLRGGRELDLPLGGLAGVGNRIWRWEARRGSGIHQNASLEAENPQFWAGVEQIQARQGFSRPPICVRRSGKFLPSINLTDLPMALCSHDSGNKLNSKLISSYSGCSFPF